MRSPNLPALAHPAALAAVGALLVNDHLLKAAWPGWWTGKLSDFAFCVVAPLVIAAPFGRRARVPAILATGVAFTALQLWPPLGAWFGSGHVADAGDLVALPLLAVPLWIWRAPARSYGALVLPLAFLSLVATTPVTEPADATWPCPDAPDVWDAADPLLILRHDHGPIDTDNFLRGLSLVDAEGEAVDFVAVEEGGLVALCATAGLAPDTDYVWQVGPWEAASQELRFSASEGVTVPFHTGAEPGPPVTSEQDCLDLLVMPAAGWGWDACGAAEDSG